MTDINPISSKKLNYCKWQLICLIFLKTRFDLAFETMTAASLTFFIGDKINGTNFETFGGALFDLVCFLVIALQMVVIFSFRINVCHSRKITLIISRVCQI